MTLKHKRYATLFACLGAAWVAGRDIGTDPWWEVMLAVVVAVAVTALIVHLTLNPFVKKVEG